MAEEKTVRVEQIEGLGDYIREEVRAAIREEARPVLEDMEEIKKSPAGMLIRLEDKVDALEMKMDQRFVAVDQHFEALESKMDQRFVAVDQHFEALESKMDQRFVAVDQHFEAVDRRFIDLKEAMDRQYTTVKWVLILIFPFLLTILGKLFLMK